MVSMMCLLLQDEAVAARVQALLSTPRFRCYRTTDVTGVELGGALKNVLAIACGKLHLRLPSFVVFCPSLPWGMCTVQCVLCVMGVGLSSVW
jgi:hypothetical protein